MGFALGSLHDLHSALALLRDLPWLQDLPALDRNLLSTVLAELGSNMLKFAGSGRLELSRTVVDGRAALVVLAQDQGPGISDTGGARQAGYSTAGTLGLGLPTVERIMSTLDIDAQPGQGTRVRAVKWLDGL